MLYGLSFYYLSEFICEEHRCYKFLRCGIEYVSCEPSDSLKELFPEGYNADDDSFEEEEMEQA